MALLMPAVAPAATPPVMPPMTACLRTPSPNYLPSTAFPMTLVPAAAAMPPTTSVPIWMPSLAAVLEAAKPLAPAIAPPAIEIGAAITPPAAPIPVWTPHCL